MSTSVIPRPDRIITPSVTERPPVPSVSSRPPAPPVAGVVCGGIGAAVASISALRDRVRDGAYGAEAASPLAERLTEVLQDLGGEREVRVPPPLAAVNHRIAQAHATLTDALLDKLALLEADDDAGRLPDDPQRCLSAPLATSAPATALVDGITRLLVMLTMWSDDRAYVQARLVRAGYSLELEHSVVAKLHTRKGYFTF